MSSFGLGWVKVSGRQRRRERRTAAPKFNVATTEIVNPPRMRLKDFRTEDRGARGMGRVVLAGSGGKVKR